MQIKLTHHSSKEGSSNLTLWKDGAPVLFADNDFDAGAKALITSKINDKRKKEYHGIPSYGANEAVRCYRDAHNNVDIHNQYLSYGHWDYRTHRKQMRVPIMVWLHTLYLRVEIGFSLFDSYAVVNPFIAVVIIKKPHLIKTSGFDW